MEIGIENLYLKCEIIQIFYSLDHSDLTVKTTDTTQAHSSSQKSQLIPRAGEFKVFFVILIHIYFKILFTTSNLILR